MVQYLINEDDNKIISSITDCNFRFEKDDLIEMQGYNKLINFKVTKYGKMIINEFNKPIVYIRGYIQESA